MNRLYFDNNLDVLSGRQIEDESIDLVYLDPPFDSSANYKERPSKVVGADCEASWREKWKKG